jgi:membrane-associated phospholipid phosphatase
MPWMWLLVASLFPQAPSPYSPYHVNPAVSLPLSIGALVLYGLSEGFVVPSLHAQPTCRLNSQGTHCDPLYLPTFERNVPQNHSKTWKTTSDALSYGSVALPLAALFVEHFLSPPHTHAVQKWLDPLILLETAAASTVATTLLKHTVRRPRPSAYAPTQRLDALDEQVSFPSGHTSLAAAMTTAYTVTFALKYPHSPWKYAVGALGVGITCATGYARVAAGRHFYTDVAAGALLGGVIGFVVPWLHRTSVQPLMNASQDGVSLGVVKTF